MASLCAPDAAWVFLSDSDEPRHLHDVVFGLSVLHRRGVPDDRIAVLTDHYAAGPHLEPFGSMRIAKIGQLADIITGFGACSTLTVVVTGHGREDGVGASLTAVKPQALLDAIRSASNLEAGVLILTQCFAGIFNLLDARTSPPLVIMGATNLNESLSADLRLDSPIPGTDGSPGLREWNANIFSFHFFEWILRPQDIDGDGKLTVIDAYKFAGTRSNRRLLKMKSELFLEAQDLAERVRSRTPEVYASLTRDPTDTAARAAVLELSSTREQLNNMLELMYLHQEPWILNATLAREITD